MPVTAIVDGHLDLAETVTLFGRDLTRPVADIRARENRSSGQATVSLPELQRGGIAVVITTVTPGFLVDDVGTDFEPRSALYSTPEEAEANALRQIALYESWASQGLVRLIRSVADLEDHLGLWKIDRVPGLVYLMESADPIVKVADLSAWWKRGLRMIGLTFGNTKYGTGVGGGRPEPWPGGLTAAGQALLKSMRELGFIWDIAHLNEPGVWEGLEIYEERVCATHANARALNPTNRHLSDDVIREVASRRGMIGLVLYNGFLEPRWREDKTLPVTLADHVRRHAEHIAGLVGWGHLGIGSDLDGGFGLEECPAEIDTIADLQKVGDAVPESAREAVLGENWLNFLRRSLPRRG